MFSSSATSLLAQPRTKSSSAHISLVHSPFSRQRSICSREGVEDGLFFQRLPLAAAGDAAGVAGAVGDLPVAGRVGRARQRHGGPAAFAAQVVGQLVGADREQVAFQRPAAVVVRQAVEKADERLLHDVFAGAAAAQAAFDEGQQPAFVAGDQVVPGVAFAAADALDEQRIGVAREDMAAGQTVDWRTSPP